MANKADRINFLNTIFADANEFARTHNLTNAADRAEYDATFDLAYWTRKIESMAEAASLGRSPAWKAACEWAQWQLEDETPSVELYRWAAFQGCVYMGNHAGN
jgi:hypothetical protein